MGYRNKTPLGQIELIVVGVPEIWDPYEAAVVPVGPTVISAGERRSVPRVSPSQAVPSMAADV